MQTYFETLCDALTPQLHTDEIYLANFSAETSDFVRFNQAKVRQAGSVSQRLLQLTLISEQRQAQAVTQLSGDVNNDSARLTALLQQLRGQLQHLVPDPYLLINEQVQSTTSLGENRLSDGQQLTTDILSTVQDLDFVGVLASGGIFRGFANSLGQRNWHSRYSFNLDWSVYHAADKAIKNRYAGEVWDKNQFTSQIMENRQKLPILQKEPHNITPGHYRVFLAPAAMEELMYMLAWGGLGIKQRETKTSCLLRLWAQQARFHPSITLCENTATSMAPCFQTEGFVKPESVTLIANGEAQTPLVSPRSAKEFGVTTNGANDEEAPDSIDMAAGNLPQSEVLRALDTGIYINNLWYLNFSDRPAARVTGMTRFATFWVENGQIVAPLNVMRFDDSLFNLLGEQLEALTQERTLLLSTDTYEQRDVSSAHLPGALIGAMQFTL